MKNSLLPDNGDAIVLPPDIPMFWQFVLVGVGGAIGAMLRYRIQNLPFFGDDKFYYTLAINISGCMLIGAIWAFLTTFGAHRWVYVLVIGGFLGGYTTFSAFSLDFILLLRQSAAQALFYGGATVIGSLGGCALTYSLTVKMLKALQ